MPAQRFVEVPAPIESRVAGSLLTQLHALVSLGVSATDHLNTTIQNIDLTERTTDAILDAMRPGGLTFVLLVLLVMATCLHSIMITRNTNRLLRTHGHFQRDDGDEGGRVHAD